MCVGSFALIHPRCNRRTDHRRTVPVADVILNDQHRTDTALLTSHNGPQVGIIYIATLDYHLCSLSDSFRFAFPYDNDPAFYAF